jgi:hypothetical protein
LPVNETIDYAVVGGGIRGAYCCWRIKRARSDNKVSIAAYYKPMSGVEVYASKEARTVHARYFDRRLDLTSNGKIGRYQRITCFDQNMYLASAKIPFICSERAATIEEQR